MKLTVEMPVYKGRLQITLILKITSSSAIKLKCVSQIVPKFGTCAKGLVANLQASVSELSTIIHKKWHQYVVMLTGQTAYAMKPKIGTWNA